MPGRIFGRTPPSPEPRTAMGPFSDPILLAIVAAFVFGVLHAFDPDHVAAVTAFVSRRPGSREAFGFGIRWALGHSLAILLAGSILILLGVRIPAGLDQALEVAIGLVLIGLALWLFRRLYHPATGQARGERQGTVAIGVVHGLAGTAALLALVPVTLIASPVWSVAYLAAFGIGTIAAMGTYGVVAGLAFRRVGAIGPVWPLRLRAAAASVTLVVGVVWVGVAMV